MLDGQWRIAYGATSFTFGTPSDGLFLSGPPDLGMPELVTDDADIPRADGQRFGQDYRGGSTITFELAAVADEAPGYGLGGYGVGPYGVSNPAAVLNAVSAAAAVWRADALRCTPGAVAELTARIAGRERTAYGRPRRFAPGLADAHNGIALVTCDFAGADDLWYGPEQALTISIVPPPGAGLLSPLASPLMSALSSTSRPGVFTVAGDVAAWPVLTVHGPITTPTVSVGAWSITVATTLAAGRSLVIDPRPWVRSVLLDTGASLAGQVTRASQRLTKATLAPGPHELTLRGTDVTGTATLALSWRDAYTTP